MASLRRHGRLFGADLGVYLAGPARPAARIQGQGDALAATHRALAARAIEPRNRPHRVRVDHSPRHGSRPKVTAHNFTGL